MTKRPSEKDLEHAWKVRATAEVTAEMVESSFVELLDGLSQEQIVHLAQTLNFSLDRSFTLRGAWQLAFRTAFILSTQTQQDVVDAYARVCLPQQIEKRVGCIRLRHKRKPEFMAMSANDEKLQLLLHNKPLLKCRGRLFVIIDSITIYSYQGLRVVSLEALRKFPEHGLAPLPLGQDHRHVSLDRPRAGLVCPCRVVTPHEHLPAFDCVLTQAFAFQLESKNKTLSVTFSSDDLKEAEHEARCIQVLLKPTKHPYLSRLLPELWTNIVLPYLTVAPFLSHVPKVLPPICSQCQA